MTSPLRYLLRAQLAFVASWALASSALAQAPVPTEQPAQPAEVKTPVAPSAPVMSLPRPNAQPSQPTVRAKRKAPPRLQSSL